MKYAPLPWVHIADALRPSVRRLRIVLEEPAFFGERTFVRLHDGPRSESITDTHLLLKGQNPLSARERAAVEILHEAGPSHAKKGRFSLTRHQIGRILAFAQDVPLEVEGKGGIAVIPRPARITGRVKELEGGTALVFEPVDGDGAKVTGKEGGQPLVLGEREAFLLDDQLKLYRLAPPLLPGETNAFLFCEPLMLQGLCTDEGKAGFEAVVSLGVDLADLVEVARRPDGHRIVLRAMLTRADDGPGFALRVHLVTELSVAGLADEVEVSARGGLPPVHAIATQPATKKPPTPPAKEEGSMVLVARPSTDEELARQALFDLGLHAAASHRGFVAVGEPSLDILVKIAAQEGVPPFIHVDRDTLPRIVKLPSVPVLNVRKIAGDKRGLLAVRLDVGEEARQLALQFDDIVRAVMAGRQSLMLDEDTVLGFTGEAGKALELIADSLELKDASSTRELGPAELAMLVAGLDGRVDIDADDPSIKQRVEEFLKAPAEEDREVPTTLTATLRPYQLEGTAWLSQLHRLGVGRILADDMGLGKTLMALTMLAKAKEKDGSKPSLVVAPTSVLDVWVDEARRHIPTLKVLKWHGRDRKGLNQKALDADVVVTSYALLRRDVDSTLGTVDFRYLMLDEAQNVKNASTEAWKAARLVKSDQRMALTGTPIENRVEELWSILDLVAPGLLGTERSFERRYGRPISKGDALRLDELRRRTRPVILRRKKEDVAKDLPPKIETVLRCEMDPEQRALYLRVLAEVRSDVQQALKVHTRARARASILAALMRLRQVCCDPRLVAEIDGKDGFGAKGVGSAKLALFEEVMSEALADPHRKVIVFSQFVEMQKLLFDVLERVGAKDALWLHGGSKNRGEIVAQFQDPNGPRVIVVSLKAGGTGVTLTAADTVVHYDPWWNPAVEDQATDRAHRIGQEKTVHVIKLACEDSIEERMLALGEDKRAAAESVLGKDGAGPKALSLDEIEGMLDAEASRGY
ncbi:MAG: DEAD/DEAH box helicase [Deltaproteobacteria bacterium]|nr:DEAD/DEAH box helicase [Deltaproteobacteria bacterium]